MADLAAKLKRWYQLDSNHVPPQFVLQCADGANGRTQEQWEQDHPALLKAINMLVGSEDADSLSHQLFNLSLAADATTTTTTKPKAVCFFRSFSDLPTSPTVLPDLVDFVDVRSGVVEEVAQGKLNNFKEKTLPALIGQDAIFQYTIPWISTAGLDTMNAQHDE